MVDAREYHERTKHAPERLRGDSFSLDVSNQPRPYKEYESVPTRSVPAAAPPGEPALAAVATETATPGGDPGTPPVDAQTLAGLCHYAAGVTKTVTRRGERVRYRAASCTGKLYHVDLYAVTGDLGGLEAGVYHFDPHTGSFDVLRTGDYRGVLARATGGHGGVASAPVTFVATSEWWRNAWKYRERTYRHAFWDSGTVLANLLAVAHAGGHRASVVAGFVDDAVAHLVGVEPEAEAPLELVPVGGGDPAPAACTVDPIDPATTPLSESVVEYPLLHDAWRESTLADADAVRSWRSDLDSLGGASLGTHGPGDGERVSLDPVDAETASSRPVGATIERRGSLREYAREAVSDRLFATVLDRALRGVPFDADDGARPRVLDCYCLVHAVDGVEPGTYQYHPGENVLERLGPVERGESGHLALDQAVVGDAAVNVYLLADVEAVVEALGNRGYRLAQLAGGIALGRLYLATYAHRRLGGRGFTFYDDLVTDQFSPRAATQTPMTMFAFGRPRRDA